MAHKEQADFCTSVKSRLPNHFKSVNVLDCGSLDINGNNRYLFEDSTYTGIDVGPGNNVDFVSNIHEYSAPNASFDTIISTECFEHDVYWMSSFFNIVRMLKPGGLVLFTCATVGRPEHGTPRTTVVDAPLLSNTSGLQVYYYRNLTASDYTSFFDMAALFSSYEFSTNPYTHDLYFWGVKRVDADMSNAVRRI